MNFPWKKWLKICQIYKLKKLKKKRKAFELPDFYDKFQNVAKRIKGFWFFSTFISSL